MGEIKKKGQVESVLNKDGLDQLTNYIKEVLLKNPKINSVAMGIPASVDSSDIFHKYHRLQNFNLKNYYENYFSIPVTVEHDMNAAVLELYSKHTITVELT